MRQAHAKYRSSEKGFETEKRYYYSPAGQEVIKRYRQSDEYRAWVLAHPNYDREWYHRVQDEAGYYHQIRTFYRGYRFLKALETAEVVEIK